MRLRQHDCRQCPERGRPAPQARAGGADRPRGLGWLRLCLRPPLRTTVDRAGRIAFVQVIEGGTGTQYPALRMRGAIGVANMKIRMLVTAGILAILAGPVLAQGVVEGAKEGSRAGQKAAGPVGGVVGGAGGAVVGGVAGGVKGVLGIKDTKRKKKT